MSEPLRIGVIGCGYWGKNYLRIFKGLSDSRLVACADMDTAKLQEILREYPDLKTYDSHRAMLADGQLDAVVIATQAKTHYEVIADSLRAGLHVLAEKPVTTEPEQASALVAMAQSGDRILAVGHTFLYNMAILKMKQLLDQGVAGQIYYLHATRTHLGPIRDDVDAVWDLAAHDIAIFNFLLGSTPIQASAAGGCYLRPDRVDVSFINLVYPAGIRGNIHVSWIDANKVRTVAVVGSRARLFFDDLNNLEKVRIFEKGISVQRSVADFGEFQYQLRDGDIVSPSIQLREPLRLQCQDFIDAVANNVQPRSNGNTGVAVVKVLNAVERSLQQGGIPIDI